MLLVPRETKERQLTICPFVSSPWDSCVRPAGYARIQVNSACAERHMYPCWMVA